MTKTHTRLVLMSLACFAVGLALGAGLYMLIHQKAEKNDNESKNVQLLRAGSAAAAALYARDYEALYRQTGLEGLRFVAFSTLSGGDQLFTREQVKAFASDEKQYIFGISPVGGLAIEMRPSEFITAYMGGSDFSLAPQIALNRIIKNSNAAENVLEYYPAPDYAVVDFYYPPSEPNGVDWISLKTVLKRVGEEYILVAFVRGVYTAQ